MIAGLRGHIAGKLLDAILVDVGGVIYRVGTSATTLGDVGEIGDEVQLRTHLIVREDQLALFGFASLDELALFDTLITVTGVGPRLACAILSRLRPDALALAISDGDVNLLATVPGIGKKTAARLIVDLRGKIPESSAGRMGPRTRQSRHCDRLATPPPRLPPRSPERRRRAVRPSKSASFTRSRTSARRVRSPARGEFRSRGRARTALQPAPTRPWPGRGVSALYGSPRRR